MYLFRTNQHHFPQNIQAYSQLITSDATLALIRGTIGLRKFLADTENIQDVVDNGLVCRLI
jgi:hypothetical protein